MNKLHVSLRRFSNSTFNARSTIILLLFIASARMMLELSVKNIPANVLASIFLDFFTFYFTMFFIFSFIISYLTEKSFFRIANFSNAGLLFGVLPPLIDFSFQKYTNTVNYKYFSRLNWFLSESGQAMGETITLWLLIFSVGWVVYQISGSYLKFFLGLLFSYASIQFLTLILLIVEKYPIIFNYEVSSGLAFFSISLISYCAMRIKAIEPALLRIVHGLPHFFIVLCGASWAGHDILDKLPHAFLVWLLVFFMIIQNDYYDRKEDIYRLYKEEITENDVFLTSLFAIILIFQFHSIYPFFIFLAGLFFLFGYLYHHSAFRLKERFCLAYKIEGIWAVLAFLIGVINQSGFPNDIQLFWPSLLIFGGGSLLSIPKDWKDIKSDRKSKIPTYYVLLLNRGFKQEYKIHIFISSLVFLGMLMPFFYFINKTVLSLTLLLPIIIGCGALLKIKNRKNAVKIYLANVSIYLFLLQYIIRACLKII